MIAAVVVLVLFVAVPSKHHLLLIQCMVSALL